MKKNVLLKGIFLLVVVSILAIGFTGCSPMPYPTTGTVYLVVSGSYYYDLYMDYNQYFNDRLQGTYVINNVSIGNHFFEAVDYWGWTWGYDSVTQYISPGANYVYLYP
ncbi:MAG TPA: hypothetical protein ENO17_09360 [Candidatus Atribacteria bacterium]|nr:hypothetical protein [Candidatus Atribacteria bacterium]